MEAFQITNKSDYDDYYIVSKAAAEEQLEKAELFCQAIRLYIEKEITL